MSQIELKFVASKKSNIVAEPEKLIQVTSVEKSRR